MRILLSILALILVLITTEAFAQKDEQQKYSERFNLGLKIAGLVQDEGQTKKMYESMTAMFGRQYENESPACMDKMSTVISDMAVKLTQSPAVKNAVGKFYADKFTTEDLKKIVVFMESDVGKKFFLSSAEMTGVVGPVMMEQYQHATADLNENMIQIANSPECQQQ